MRINYYRFPDDATEESMCAAGCEATLKDGSHQILGDYNVYLSHKDEVDSIDHTIGGLSVTSVKAYIAQYGGIGWTCHCERDGSLFETSEIKLNGNNSRFKYNHHL